MNLFNRNIFKNAFLGFWAGSLLLASGCQKFLDVQSTHLVGEKDFWSSIEDTRSALLGTYGLLRAAMVDNDTYWLMGDLRMGDFESTQRRDLDAIIKNKLRINNSLIQTISNWRRFYAVIDNANLFIENAAQVLDKDRRYTEDNYKVDLAQVRALRAFTYFYMVRIWGDVPLVTSSEDGSFTRKARTDQKKVLAFATSELLEAVKDLPFRYGTVNDPVIQGNYYDEDNSRWAGALMTKVTAYAILAHIAAWEGDYIDAAVYTKYVINNYSNSDAGYITTDQLTGTTGLFYGNNANQLFALVFPWAHQEGTVDGHIEDLTLAAPLTSKMVPDIYIPKDTILNVFDEMGDTRFQIDSAGKPESTYFTNYEGITPIFSKIRIIRNGTTDGSLAIFSSSLVFTRVEEIALLRAEALAVLGNREDAIDMLNSVRQERGLPRYLDSDGDLIDNIFKERRRELMGEGWRWYDQVRYNKIKRDNQAFDSLIDEGGIYWPIADEVLDNNELLTQNSYWK